MSAAPRHLAPRRRGRRLALTAGVAVVLAAAVLTVTLLARGQRPGTTDAPSVPAFSAPATTAGGAATTAPPPRQPRPDSGNLLAGGDFESGLGGWGALGGARVERVAGARSGVWMVRISPGHAGAPGRAGIAAPLAVQAREGLTYRGSAWVRASRPGLQATLALREYGAGGQSSADVTGVSLPDGQWHEVAVVHQVRLSGARLALEVAGDLGAGDQILVDEVGVTAP
jgi:Carbohydrate binding domain